MPLVPMLLTIEMPRKPKLHRWRISLIRKEGEFLGVVDALGEAAAIKQAIKQFFITDPKRQRRLVAERIEKSN